MPGPITEHANLVLHDHPVIADKLTRLRDKDTGVTTFRRLLNEITGLMLYELTRSFAVEEVEVSTPLETTSGHRLSAPVTLVPILRAGVGMTDGILSIMPDARVGHVGVYRDEETREPVEYYCKLPDDIANGPVLLVDPMLATGGSASHAASILRDRGCNDLQMVCLVAAPEGVERMARDHEDLIVHTAALDRELDDHAYIRPGLGDAGDRIFGTL